MSKHTPLPWKLEADRSRIVSTAEDEDELQYTIIDLLGAMGGVDVDEDARFIVRACNNHYDLLREAEIALDKLEIMLSNIDWNHNFSGLRSAIARAKGEHHE